MKRNPVNKLDPNEQCFCGENHYLQTLEVLSELPEMHEMEINQFARLSGKPFKEVKKIYIRSAIKAKEQ